MVFITSLPFDHLVLSPFPPWYLLYKFTICPPWDPDMLTMSTPTCHLIAACTLQVPPSDRYLQSCKKTQNTCFFWFNVIK